MPRKGRKNYMGKKNIKKKKEKISPPLVSAKGGHPKNNIVGLPLLSFVMRLEPLMFAWS